jgi:hypothetical protein
MEVEGVIPIVNVFGEVTFGQVKCYNATETLTVAGDGKTFTVQDGGQVIMVAGVNIIYLPETRVYAGAYMHGFITTNSQYCGQQSPTLPSVVTASWEREAVVASPTLRIYPNPTSGAFTIEQQGDNLSQRLDIEIYGMRGERVMKELMLGEKSHEYSVTDLPHGLYFVKVSSGDTTQTFKLVKTKN